MAGKRMYLIGAAAIGRVRLPLFRAARHHDAGLVFLAIVLSLIPHDMMYGPQAALIAESFTSRLRYSGASLGYQLASVIAGGPAPLIATALFAATNPARDRGLHPGLRIDQPDIGRPGARLHEPGHFRRIRRGLNSIYRFPAGERTHRMTEVAAANSDHGCAGPRRGTHASVVGRRQRSGNAPKGEKGAMVLDPVILSRIQFAFVVSFHIIFPAFTIGLGGLARDHRGHGLATGKPVYRRVFDFWLKIFALSFAMGVVSGIVMAFQFGTNWSVLAERTGPIQGPLLGYEALHRLHAGSDLLRRHAARPRPDAALVLFLLLLHGLAGNHVLVVLDPRATTAGCRFRSATPSIDGKIIPDDWWAITPARSMRRALAAHAARRLSDHRHERHRHRRLAPAARHASARRRA